MKLFEAFEALDALNEETFAVSDDGVEKLDTFMQDNEDSDDIVDVIDPEAETEEDIQDSYVGKVILDCSVCHSKIYKDKTEVTIDEEQQLANVGEDCPYCYTSDGFKVIGEVAPFDDNDEDTVDVKEEEEEVVEESLTEAVGTLEKPMSAFSGTLSNVMTAHQGELASIGSKVEALSFLDSIEPEVKNKGYLATVKEKVAKLPDFKVLTFLYNIILKGDGMGSKLESLTESHRGDRHRVTAELFDILSENGFDTDAEDVEDYVFAARDLVFEEVLADPSKSIREIVEQWFEDTKVNYPEDLEALTRFEEGVIPTPPMPNLGGLLEDGKEDLDEFMDANITLDAKGFGGKDNNVSVLGGKIPFGEDKEIEEGIFGIKTKKEKEKEAKAKAEKERQKQRDKELKDQEERDRQQFVIDSWKRREKAERDAQREYNRSRYNGIRGDKPSNTGYRGVNYSGGDYYTESKSTKENLEEIRMIVDEEFPLAHQDLGNKSLNDYIDYFKQITKVTSTMKKLITDYYNDYVEDGEIVNESKSIKESGGAGFRLDNRTMLDIEDLADAVYRDDEEYIKKYVSKVNKDINVNDLSIAAENSDYPREVKYLIAHMKNKGYNTIGDFSKALDESKSIKEDIDEDTLYLDSGDVTFNDDESILVPTDIFDNFKKNAYVDIEFTDDAMLGAGTYIMTELIDDDYIKMIPFESFDESKSINEDINNLSLDTDDTHMEMSSDENGKVTITTEPIEKTNTSDEVIVPVSDETKTEIENNAFETEEDVDFEEFDETSFDELGESYLKESFDNVVTFRTNDVTMSGDNLIVEGLIKFDSGNVKKTSFTFTAKDFLKEGLYRFVGKNNQLVENNTFELVGKIKDTKFICESLTEIR